MSKIGQLNENGINVFPVLYKKSFARIGSATKYKRIFRWTAPIAWERSYFLLHIMSRAEQNDSILLNVKLVVNNSTTDTGAMVRYIPLSGSIEVYVVRYATSSNVIFELYVRQTAVPASAYDVTLLTQSLGSNTQLDFTEQASITDLPSGTVTNATNVLNTIITTGTEYLTGKMIDGKVEYAKRINIGTLPNNATKTIAHGLSNVTFTKPILGIANNGSYNLNLPHIEASGTGSIQASANNANIYVTTTNDRSTYNNCYLDLYYTKNT